jgi:hypothetical protein
LDNEENKKAKVKMNIGKFKAIMDRQRNYLAFINFLMIGYLFLQKTGFHWWYLLIIPAWIVFSYLDIRFIWPQELDYSHRKSPVMRELLKK